MDAMRSVFMMLGVVLHSANVFATRQSWVLTSQNTTIIADRIEESIHIFRMPAFFVIAGFFCMLSLGKYTPGKFLGVRMKRIIIPLVVTAVTLNTLQAILLTRIYDRQFELNNYLYEGGWISHLWFLNNLIIYFLLSAVVAVYFKKPVEVAGRLLNQVVSIVPITGILLLLPTVSLMILGLNRTGFPLYSEVYGVLNIYNIMIYLPYFAFGVLLGANRELLNRFSSVNPAFSLLLILVAVSIMHSEIFQNEIIHAYLQYLVVWVAVSLCFTMFYRLFNSASDTWLYLSDASYTIYLFHHIIVIAIGYLILQLEFDPLVSLFFLIIITMTISLYIHKYIILKSGIARLLFNGK